jgi:CheY-like chemotaxis protein
MTKRILVIDDEDGVREIIQISLEAATDWEVVAVASGPEGLEAIQQSQFDAVLLDVMMPAMDGCDTLEQLQASEATRQIPTILLTAKASTTDHQRFMNLGVAGVITKPFKAQKLVEQIRSILNWDKS